MWWQLAPFFLLTLYGVVKHLQSVRDVHKCFDNPGFQVFSILSPNNTLIPSYCPTLCCPMQRLVQKFSHGGANYSFGNLKGGSVITSA